MPDRTILIEKKDGSQVMVTGIPGDAKITFGPLTPGSRSGGYHTDGGQRLGLRIYTSSENQLAVFTDVKSFRDTALKVAERKENLSVSVSEKYDSNTGEIVSKTDLHESREVVWEQDDINDWPFS
jgi:hypothetical protein